MSYRAILVYVDTAPECDARIRSAVALAKSFDAQLIGLAAGTIQPPMVDPMTGLVVSTWVDVEREQIVEDLKAAEAKFRSLAVGIETEWRAFFDSPALALAEAAGAADLIVIGRESKTFPHNAARSVITGDLLMSAGRPILVVPDQDSTRTMRNVLVAWQDRREARRALADALPILKRAEEVILLEVQESGEAGQSLNDAKAFLARHGISARTDIRQLDSETAESQILDYAKKAQSDLIVAGAYGHTRLREWVFGGVTRELLTGAPASCLLSH